MSQAKTVWKQLIHSVVVAHLTSSQRETWRPTIQLLTKTQLTAPLICENALQQSQLAELNKALDIINIREHAHLYAHLYEAINDYFKNLSKHASHAEVTALKDEYKNTQQWNHLWAISIFTALTTVQPVITVDNTQSAKVLVSVVEYAGLALYDFIKLSAGKPIGIKLIVLKKYIHVLLHLFADTRKYYSLSVEDRTKVISLRDLLNDHNPTITPVMSQVTMLQLHVDFAVNNDKNYNISPTPTNFMRVDDVWYVYTDFILGGHQLIIQHYGKIRTSINDDFIAAARYLGQTEFVLDTHMVALITDLVTNEISGLYKLIASLTGEPIPSPHAAKLSLGASARDTCKIRRVRDYLQKLLVKAHTGKATDGLQDFVKRTNINYNLLQAVFSKHKEEQQLINETQTLQRAFSHLLLYTSYLNYIDYLVANQRTSVYFSPYSDFRGRLYYKSEASPQSLWCFRFLYYYRATLEGVVEYPLYEYQISFLSKLTDKVINPAAIEFLQAIGVIFKSKLIDPETGAFSLSAILNLGYSMYLKYKSYNAIANSDNLELKDLAELLYYIQAFSYESSGVRRGYYIWKDTTASVIQHGGRLLGYREGCLKFLNLSNTDIAYDTYQVVINEIKKQLTSDCDINPSVLPLLTRKSLKQLIMTCEYQVSHQTAWGRYSYLVASMGEVDKRYKVLNDPALFKKLYRILSKGVVARLFYQKTQDVWFGSTTVIDYGDMVLDATYYLPIYQSVYYEKGTPDNRQRAVLKTIVPAWETTKSLEVDSQKTRQAAYVNFVHAHDAAFLRRILRLAQQDNIEISAIHDGFGVAYYNSKWLVGAANAVFWVQPTGYYSATIII